MQFSCNRQRLADVLALLGEAVPSRSPKPVLLNIHLTAGTSPNTIVLSATDLEIGLRHHFEVENLSDPDTILLPAARLTSLVRDDRSRDISFTITGNVAKIKTEYGQFQLHGLAGEDFPPIPELPAERQVRMNGDDLADAAQKTLFSVARGDMRYALNGVYTVIGEQSCDFVSSDTHRLSRVTKKINNAEKITADGIVITKGIATLARLSQGRETVTLVMTDKQLIAQTLDATLAVRLVEGQFPRYRDVIPEKLEKRLTVNREEIVWRLRNIGILTSDETHGVQFETQGENQLLIRATGNEAGEGSMEIEAEIKGGALKMGFNYVYLLDVLKVMDDEKVTFQVRDGDSPARIDSGEFTHVIMPIRGK